MQNGPTGQNPFSTAGAGASADDFEAKNKAEIPNEFAEWGKNSPERNPQELGSKISELSSNQDPNSNIETENNFENPDDTKVEYGKIIPYMPPNKKNEQGGNPSEAEVIKASFDNLGIDAKKIKTDKSLSPEAIKAIDKAKSQLHNKKILVAEFEEIIRKLAETNLVNSFDDREEWGKAA